MSAFVADIEIKAVMEEIIILEKDKAEEANVLDEENDA